MRNNPGRPHVSFKGTRIINCKIKKQNDQMCVTNSTNAQDITEITVTDQPKKEESETFSSPYESTCTLNYKRTSCCTLKPTKCPDTLSMETKTATCGCFQFIAVV